MDELFLDFLGEMMVEILTVGLAVGIGLSIIFVVLLYAVCSDWARKNLRGSSGS